MKKAPGRPLHQTTQSGKKRVKLRYLGVVRPDELTWGRKGTDRRKREVLS